SDDLKDVLRHRASPSFTHKNKVGQLDMARTGHRGSDLPERRGVSRPGLHLDPVDRLALQSVVSLPPRHGDRRRPERCDAFLPDRSTSGANSLAIKICRNHDLLIRVKIPRPVVPVIGEYTNTLLAQLLIELSEGISIC